MNQFVGNTCQIAFIRESALIGINTVSMPIYLANLRITYIKYKLEYYLFVGLISQNCD